MGIRRHRTLPRCAVVALILAVSLCCVRERLQPCLPDACLAPFFLVNRTQRRRPGSGASRSRASTTTSATAPTAATSRGRLPARTSRCPLLHGTLQLFVDHARAHTAESRLPRSSLWADALRCSRAALWTRRTVATAPSRPRGPLRSRRPLSAPGSAAAVSRRTAARCRSRESTTASASEYLPCLFADCRLPRFMDVVALWIVALHLIPFGAWFSAAAATARTSSQDALRARTCAMRTRQSDRQIDRFPDFARNDKSNNRVLLEQLHDLREGLLALPNTKTAIN